MKSSLSMETCRIRRQGGIWLAHTWQLNQIEHRSSPNSNILSLLKLRRGKCSYFMQEPFMVALLGGDAFLRMKYIPFWKLSGPGGTCGKNFLSLADREPNPFSLNLDSLPSLGSLTHPLVLENLSRVLAKPSWTRSTLSSGAHWAEGAVKCINTLSSLASSCSNFSQRCSKKPSMS